MAWLKPEYSHGVLPLSSLSMDFSSHFHLADVAMQALANAEGHSLIPALQAWGENHSGTGSAIDTEAFERVYETLQGQVGPSSHLEASLEMAWATAFETALGGNDRWANILETVTAAELEPWVSADLGALVLGELDGGAAQLVSALPSGGEQAVVDALTGLIWQGVEQVKAATEQPILLLHQGQQFLGESSVTAGEFMGPLLPVVEQQLTPPISLMRLDADDVAPAQIDLLVQDVTVQGDRPGLGGAIAPGESLTVEASFHNRGNQVVGSSTIRYWLSDDLVLDSADQALGSQQLEALAPDSQARQSIRFEHQPTWGAGAKYVLVEADGDHGLAESNEINNLSAATIELEPVDLQQYWFYYSFNPENPESADSYIGSVIAPEGTYQLAPSLPGGGHDPAYGFNPTTQLTEAHTDGKYLVYGKSNYDDDLVADLGKVFVLSYTDRAGELSQQVTPNQYAQGQKPSGFNFLGSESDYLGAASTAIARFGQDYYEADTGNPDLEIQAYTPFGYFSESQRSAIDTAIDNWEQLIVGDKDDSGVLKLAFTHMAQRIDGSEWSWVWGEAYLDSVVGERLDRDYDVVDIGGDFHNRVNYNSVKLGQLSSNQLIRLTMHEIGHALGLDEAQEDGLLGLDSVMDKHGLDPKVTEGMFQRLESLGYKVNRAAANGLQWDLSALALS